MNIVITTTSERAEETDPAVATENVVMYNIPLEGLSPHHNDSAVYVYNSSQSTEVALTDREIFYQSYNPEVGLHTAAVLGGILVWVILYLVYRTKIRKAVIRLIRRKRNKDRVYVEKEVMGKFIPTPVDVSCSPASKVDQPDPVQAFFGQNFVIDQVATSSQSVTQCPKMVVNENSNSPTVELIINEHNQSPTRDDQTALPPPHILPSCNVSSSSMSFPDPQTQPQQLPSVETDVVIATAMWVHDQPLSSHSNSVQGIAGVILKVTPDAWNHVTRSCPIDTLSSSHPPTLIPLSKTWNKSMPTLPQNSGGRTPHTHFAPEKKSISMEAKKVKVLPKLTIPIPDMTEYGSTSRLERSCYSGLYYPSVPIPVTPTVMIQNFTSKGSNKSASIHIGNSNESLTSGSSEDRLATQPTLQVGWAGKQMLAQTRTIDPVGENILTPNRTKELTSINMIVPGGKDLMCCQNSKLYQQQQRPLTSQLSAAIQADHMETML